MAKQQDMADLFEYWLAGQLDEDNASSYEVEDRGGGGVIGEFCVDHVEPLASRDTTMEFLVTFEDGSRVTIKVSKHRHGDPI